MLEAVNEGKDLKTAYGLEGGVPDKAEHCSACFTGVYPIKHELLEPLTPRDKRW